MNKPRSKRFVIDVDDEFHKKVKDRAKERNITLRKYILRAILQALKQEDKFI